MKLCKFFTKSTAFYMQQDFLANKSKELWECENLVFTLISISRQRFLTVIDHLLEQQKSFAILIITLSGFGNYHYIFSSLAWFFSWKSWPSVVKIHLINIYFNLKSCCWKSKVLYIIFNIWYEHSIHTISEQLAKKCNSTLYRNFTEL